MDHVTHVCKVSQKLVSIHTHIYILWPTYYNYNDYLTHIEYTIFHVVLFYRLMCKVERKQSKKKKNEEANFSFDVIVT